jgi:hypothetical protein
LYSPPNTIRNIKRKEEEMGRACSAHGKKMNAYRVFGGRAIRKDIDGGGRIILKGPWIYMTEGIDWIDLA